MAKNKKQIALMQALNTINIRTLLSVSGVFLRQKFIVTVLILNQNSNHQYLLKLKIITWSYKFHSFCNLIAHYKGG